MNNSTQSVERRVEIDRAWAMPNKNTFLIPCINELIQKHIGPRSIDPFANSCRIATVTNDINPAYEPDYCMDALDFLMHWPQSSFDTVLFDPPFSPRQISEGYKAVGVDVTQQMTSAKFWGDIKNEIARITKQEGKVITCGWNSNGIGRTRGFRKVEILLVAHGAWHNDTIVTVEEKLPETSTP